MCIEDKEKCELTNARAIPYEAIHREQNINNKCNNAEATITNS